MPIARIGKLFVNGIPDIPVICQALKMIKRLKTATGFRIRSGMTAAAKDDGRRG